MLHAIVTGAGRGIGRATALALARRGASVSLLARGRDALDEIAAEIAAGGGAAHVAVADVGVELAVADAARSCLARFGPPAVVVHNAGVAGRRAPIEDVTPAEWDAVLAANLRGPYLLTRALLPAMRAAGRGRFVVVSSISATLGTAGLAAYCASKWGVVGFAKALAEELRGSGLQAMSVLPGTVDTPMAKVGGFPPQMSPDDVAGLVVYAALDAPAAMNGSAIECFGP